MAQNIREKRNRMMKTRKIIASALLLLVFFLLSVYYIIKSDFFNLKTINITGNDYVTYDELVEMSGLIYNRNIFQYNLEEVKFNIERHSFVENAEVVKKLPSRLNIIINEREKYAIIPYMGRFVYIDYKLNVLDVIDDYFFEDLVLITGLDIHSILVGEEINTGNNKELEYILKIIEATKLAGINHMISEISLIGDNTISLIIINGIEALINVESDPAYIIVSLREVLTKLTGNDRNIVIDMRFEGGFSVKEKSN